MLLESSIIDEWEELSVKGSNSDFKSIDSQFNHRAKARHIARQMCFCTCLIFLTSTSTSHGLISSLYNPILIGKKFSS